MEVILIKRESQSYLASSTRNLIATPWPPPQKNQARILPSIFGARLISPKFDYERNLEKYWRAG